ncbi:MAG: hypothetical protein M1838_001196 [Thelocarpon superellum]|nr:MAG: hypothetical protein M1838_001196 [Thelocarpon superellum]
MAEEAPPPRSISARIAALQLGQVGRAPSATPASPSRSPAPPRPPTRPATVRPALDDRRNTTNNPPIHTNGTTGGQRTGNRPIGARNNGILPPPSINCTHVEDEQTPKPSPPQLPARRGSAQPSPSLPPRRPSDHLTSRRGSNDSLSSAVSNVSSVSALSIGTGTTSASRSPTTEQTSGRVKAPVYNPSTLPVLPPKRSDTDDGRGRTLQKSAQAIISVKPPPLPARASPPPPRLPARRAETVDLGRRLPPNQSAPAPTRSALSLGLNQSTEKPPPTPARPNATAAAPTAEEGTATPPPIPLASRPSAAQMQAGRRPVAAEQATSCLRCRDFSGPDAHAARFPRQAVQSSSVDWLSQQLTAPFPSATDKARVIFTWLHHNIEYDVASFFGNSVGPSTPQSTISTGLAVCEGYAGLFCALAAKAGLESVVLGGHGKGYGFAPPAPGSAIPPYSAGHAWNAVKIDDKTWKLVDPCWGAGAVNGPDIPYIKAFAPTHFTMTNNDFGLRHFPEDRRSFFREDGRTPSWEAYMSGADDDAGGDPVQIMTAAPGKYGLSETSFTPRHRTIDVSHAATAATNTANSALRFQFRKTCAHWNHATMSGGLPYVFVLGIQGPGGNKPDYVPFAHHADYSAWWCDVPMRELGRAGQTVSVNAVTTIDGRDARGWSRQDYLAAKGRKSMAWEGVAVWSLV